MNPITIIIMIVLGIICAIVHKKYDNILEDNLEIVIYRAD